MVVEQVLNTCQDIDWRVREELTPLLTPIHSQGERGFKLAVIRKVDDTETE